MIGWAIAIWLYAIVAIYHYEQQHFIAKALTEVAEEIKAETGDEIVIPGIVQRIAAAILWPAIVTWQVVRGN